MGTLEPLTSMLTLTLQPQAQIVCIGAHCDDIEIGCAGALIALAQRWPDAHFHCWVFSGDALRASESKNCLTQLLGAERFSLQVFDHSDGFFPAEWASIKNRIGLLRGTVDPALVLTHARSDLHQDHRTLSELTWNHFRGHTILEYEIVKWEGDLANPNLYVALTPEQLALKVNALMSAFASQAGKSWFTRSTFEALARIRGVEANAPHGLAEGFHARKAVLAPFGSA